MKELLIAAIIFGIAFVFAICYFWIFQQKQLELSKSSPFWNNRHVFETIPAMFPTLGILCTALGITLGIWEFDTEEIGKSMPKLLEGLKLAFFATIAGIVGLIVFQKWAAVITGVIENNPNLPQVESNELGALNTLIAKFDTFQKTNESKLQQLSDVFSEKLNALEQSNTAKTADMSEILKGVDVSVKEGLNQVNLTLLSQEVKSDALLTEIDKSLKVLQSENKEFNTQSVKNSESIIQAMSKNNAYIIEKFETFSELLAKNNTEALVDVMKNVTETFNNQMSELIERLVKENFEELNNSVQMMNTWQKEHKEQVATLTTNYKELTSSFKDNATVLNEVTSNVETLVGENSKLNELVDLMNTVLIEENNFTEITNKLSNTVTLLDANTEAFTETTNKLNEWVRTERNFKDAADALIVKLEQFRDFNSDVWKNYRREMESAVGIIENTSITISKNIADIDDEFYERLNGTLEGLDLCIRRAIEKYD